MDGVVVVVGAELSVEVRSGGEPVTGRGSVVDVDADVLRGSEELVWVAGCVGVPEDESSVDRIVLLCGNPVGDTMFASRVDDAANFDTSGVITSTALTRTAALVSRCDDEGCVT